MVELDEFIAEAMTSIVRGIKKGQADDAVGAYIAPMIQGSKRNDVGNFHLKGDDSRQATVVGFDVQVATETSKGTDGKAGLKARLVVVDVSLTGSGNALNQQSSVHRLQFAVPVEIPTRDPETART